MQHPEIDIILCSLYRTKIHANIADRLIQDKRQAIRDRSRALFSRGELLIGRPIIKLRVLDTRIGSSIILRLRESVEKKTI